MGVPKTSGIGQVRRYVFRYSTLNLWYVRIEQMRVLQAADVESEFAIEYAETSLRERNMLNLGVNCPRFMTRASRVREIVGERSMEGSSLCSGSPLDDTT
jgi:hypothetical protein